MTCGRAAKDRTASRADADKLTIDLEWSGHWWVATVRERPGIVSQGESPAIATAKIANAMRVVEREGAGFWRPRDGVE